jgi:hypothetical protein
MDFAVLFSTVLIDRLIMTFYVVKAMKEAMLLPVFSDYVFHDSEQITQSKV